VASHFDTPAWRPLRSRHTRNDKDAVGSRKAARRIFHSIVDHAGTKTMFGEPVNVAGDSCCRVRIDWPYLLRREASPEVIMPGQNLQNSHVFPHGGGFLELSLKNTESAVWRRH
jgi:hypothetical protein